MPNLKKLLKLSPAKQTELIYHESTEYYTRYSSNAISENISNNDKLLEIRVVQGKKMGTAQTNKLDKDNVKKAYDKAMLAMNAQKKDKTILNLPKKEKYNESNLYDRDTALFSPEMKAEVLKELLNDKNTKDLKISGLFTNGSNYMAIANSNGIFADYTSSHAGISFTIDKNGSSSSWNQESYKISDLKPEKVFKQAKDFAILNQNPKNIKPGKYDVILTPHAFEELIYFLVFYGLSTLSYLEKRSPVNGKLGKQIFSKKFSLYENPFEKDAGAMPFDYEGMPKQKVMLIKNGVLENFVHDRKTAKKMKTKSTGHSLGEPNTLGPVPMSPVIAGGSATEQEMIKSMKKGLYIRKLHYTNMLNEQELLVTGMTRDGIFFVENGEIKHAVKNMRFGDSLFRILSNIDMLGQQETLSFSDGWAKIPWIKINDFNFTSSTDF